MSGLRTRIRRWSDTATRALNRAVVPALVERRFGAGVANPAALRHVAVYRELGIAFNRIKKNANSTSVVLLHQLESGIEAHERDAKLASLHLEKMPWTCWPELGRWSFVVVVRDPYSRVLSAFMNKFAKSKYVEAFGSYEISPAGFAQFLHWLEGGGLAADPHWDLQRKLMLLPLEKYDEVIRFETYSAQMRALLLRRGIEPSPKVDALIGHADGRPLRAADGKQASFYTPALRALVRELYREDFEALGYPLEPPAS